ALKKEQKKKIKKEKEKQKQNVDQNDDSKQKDNQQQDPAVVSREFKPAETEQEQDIEPVKERGGFTLQDQDQEQKPDDEEDIKVIDRGEVYQRYLDQIKKEEEEKEQQQDPAVVTREFKPEITEQEQEQQEPIKERGGFSLQGEQPQEEEEIKIIDRGEVYQRYLDQKKQEEEQPQEDLHEDHSIVARGFPPPIKQEKEDYQHVKGKVLITLQKLTNITASDINGKSDPYVIFKLGDQEYKSKTISNSLNPEYNESFEFRYDPDATTEKQLRIEVYDYDRLNKDDFLGSTFVKFGKYPDNQQDIELNIVGTDKKNAGKAYLSIKFEKEQEQDQEPIKERGGFNLQDQEQEQKSEEEQDIQVIDRGEVYQRYIDQKKKDEEEQQEKEDEVNQVQKQPQEIVENKTPDNFHPDQEKLVRMRTHEVIIVPEEEDKEEDVDNKPTQDSEQGKDADADDQSKEADADSNIDDKDKNKFGSTRHSQGDFAPIDETQETEAPTEQPAKEEEQEQQQEKQQQEQQAPQTDAPQEEVTEPQAGNDTWNDSEPEPDVDQEAEAVVDANDNADGGSDQNKYEQDEQQPGED
ncbi:MAG: hypothetical protein EZS28_010197, partial [Streblomastix strix]